MSTGARTNVGVHYLTRMRATLRAPPSKWAIEAFFRRVSAANRGRGQPRRGYRRTKPATRSGAGRLWSRRAAGFLLHTFLSPPKEKCERPMGRQVPIRAGVGASIPIKREFLTAKLLPTMQAGWLSARPLHPLRIANRNNRAPLGTASPNSRRGEFLTAKLSFNEAMQGAFRSPPAPLREVGVPMG